MPSSTYRLLANVRAYIDSWALSRVNKRPERNPKIIAILICIGANLLPTAAGAQPLPGSMANHPFFGMISTGFAALGCLLCVLGLITPSKWRDAGLSVEIAGTVFLAAGLGFYAVGLYQYTDQAQRAYAFGASLGISIGSILRTVQIALYVRGRKLADQPPGTAL